MVNGASGFASAVAATVITQPTDGLRTRMQVPSPHFPQHVRAGTPVCAQHTHAAAVNCACCFLGRYDAICFAAHETISACLDRN